MKQTVFFIVLYAYLTLAQAEVLINEVLINHKGEDTTEYIELFGTPNESLAGLSFIVVECDDNHSQGKIDRRIDFLSTDIIGNNGFYLIGNDKGLLQHYGVKPDKKIKTKYLENGNSTYALVKTNSLHGKSITGDELLIDAVAVSNGKGNTKFYFSAPVIVGQRGKIPAGVRRASDGVDNNLASDWVNASYYLGQRNTPTPSYKQFTVGPLQISIMKIQGERQFSEFQNQLVSTSGIVTMYSKNRRHFWIQDVVGDNNPRTSDAIFISANLSKSAIHPGVGDLVQVTGRVEEKRSHNDLPLTRINHVAEIKILKRNQTLPKAIELTRLPDLSIVEGIQFWEPLEGMQVSLVDAVIVSPTSKYNQITALSKYNALSGSGFYEENGHLLLQADNNMQVDYNPERILIELSGLKNKIHAKPGDHIIKTHGVIDYRFSHYVLNAQEFEWEKHSSDEARIIKQSQKYETDEVLNVVSFNVENLFDLEDDPRKKDEGSTPTKKQLRVKTNKLVLAVIEEMNLPEIVVVQEIENTEVLQLVADKVNDIANTDYVAFSIDSGDFRGIEVGFLYDKKRIGLNKGYLLNSVKLEDKRIKYKGRSPLVGVFEYKSNVITIVGVHFNSKLKDEPLFGVNQPASRRSEVVRKQQAKVVRVFVEKQLKKNPLALIMVTGDFNDFYFSEPAEGELHPVAIILGKKNTRANEKFYNLIDSLAAEEKYTYIYKGNSQAIDHMLVSPELYKLNHNYLILHFNANYPIKHKYNATTPYRVSDHDAIEGQFNLP